ncbi:hypothetical protein PV11_08238 [Exophiala sideris]|uniref:Uncharacterized protein n=1 Tax=Exophiala sideris TaxID=1016849 RepID=A0A0D1VWT7_9EURO|nr:hypothetical protein PV11_08238 [Exophiala sideris]
MKECETTVKQAQEVAVYFKRHAKQYEILKDEQLHLYGKHYALILAVTTRWGSQFGLLQRLDKIRVAITRWSSSPSADKDKKSQEIRAIIEQPEFFEKVANLVKLLKPIHEAQIDSEAINSHTGLVYARWLGLRADIQKLINDGTVELKDEIFGQIFDARMRRQVKDIHLLAFHLNPQFIKFKIDGGKKYHQLGDEELQEFEDNMNFLKDEGYESAPIVFTDEDLSAIYRDGLVMPNKDRTGWLVVYETRQAVGEPKALHYDEYLTRDAAFAAVRKRQGAAKGKLTASRARVEGIRAVLNNPTGIAAATATPKTPQTEATTGLQSDEDGLDYDDSSDSTGSEKGENCEISAGIYD